MARLVLALNREGRQFGVHTVPCILLAFLLLAACGTKEFSIEDAVPDRSLITGSIPPSSVVADDTMRSDEATIRDAISSAIVNEIGEAGIGWQNAGTGSRGTISQVLESRETGYLCRMFTASRESFEGVHLYQGETCLGAEQSWFMRSFERL